MGVLLSAIRLFGPAILRGAEAGTLAEIAQTAARLFALLRPLLDDPEGRRMLDELHTAVAETAGFRPAQPEDPVFAHQSQQRFGGR